MDLVVLSKNVKIYGIVESLRRWFSLVHNKIHERKQPQKLYKQCLALLPPSVVVRIETMARTKRTSTPKNVSRVARVAARVAGLRTPAKPVKHTSRKQGADLLTPARWKVITAYYHLMCGRSRLPPGGMAKLKNRFPRLNHTARLVQRLAKDNVFNLSKAVLTCWHEYPLERMTAVWRCLYASFTGILEAKGGNGYSLHASCRRTHRRSPSAGKDHDRSYTLNQIETAEKYPDQLGRLIEERTTGVGDERGSDLASSSSDDDE